MNSQIINLAQCKLNKDTAYTVNKNGSKICRLQFATQKQTNHFPASVTPAPSNI